MGETGIQAEILSLNLVGVWHYKVTQLTCAICRNKITEDCVTCQKKSKDILNQKCNIARGKCGHGFHYHCIDGWLNQGIHDCPIDKTPWNYDIENMDGAKRKKLLNRRRKPAMSQGTSDKQDNTKKGLPVMETVD